MLATLKGLQARIVANRTSKQDRMLALMSKPIGGFGRHRLQTIDSLAKWTLGLNGVGLLTCFAFITSEYQIAFGDCVTRHVSAYSIWFIANVSLAFLVGALSSGCGIVHHNALLGRYLHKNQMAAEKLQASAVTEPDQISEGEAEKLSNYSGWFFAFSIAFFMLGLIFVYISVYTITPTSLEHTVKELEKLCPK